MAGDVGAFGPGLAEMGNSRIRVVVRGRVQGVGYRMFVQRQARRLQLCGWVRNRATGDVELVAEGNVEALTELAKALRAGPPGARVESLAQAEIPASDRDEARLGFEIRY